MSVARRLAQLLPAPLKAVLKSAGVRAPRSQASVSARRAANTPLPSKTAATKVPAAAKKPATLAMIARGDDLAGRSLPAGKLVAQARDRILGGEQLTVVSAGEGLRLQKKSSALGSLLLAIVAVDRGFLDAAWVHFQAVPVALWSRHALREYAIAGTATAPDPAVDALVALAGEPAEHVSPEGWFEACSRTFGLGRTAAARVLYARFDGAVDAATDPTPSIVQHRDWLRSWVAAEPTSPTGPAAEQGHVTFAVMDYGHPGRSRASANIGDHVQSIASLGHVVRHRNVTFHGSDELVQLMDDLAARVPDTLQVDGPKVDLDVLTVHRDASMYSPIPANTWTLGFGWFMHPIYEVRCGFPFHDNLLPIFVSFHCSKRQLLTEDAVAYLKRFGPIGCRDWTTVDILLSLGVEAFFSGCMTTTVSTVFPLEATYSPSQNVAYVDMAPDAVPTGAMTYRHSSDAIRFRSFERNVYDAVDLLETYRREHSRIVTTRLHAYLPSRSLGVEVDFLPNNRSDPRFEGLIGITDEQFTAIQSGIMDKLQTVLALAFSGAAPDVVYARWAELTADEVEVARARHDAAPRFEALEDRVVQAIGDAAAATARLRENPSHLGEAPLELAVHVGAQQPASLTRNLPILVAAAQRSTRRPINLTLITRLGEVDSQSWLDLAPEVGLSVVSTAGLAACLHRPDGRTITARDLDLAVLPLLLPSVARVLVLPGTAVAVGDLSELFDLDLGGHLLGAPTTRGTRGASGFGLIHAAAGRLRDATAPAAELRRVAHARHAFDFDSLTTSVMVLDLEGLRRDRFVQTYVSLMAEYGLTLRDLLCLLAGPDRAEIPVEWDVVPTRDAGVEPRLVHFSDGLKPWQKSVVPGSEVWFAKAAG